jgi:C1A family cysteine protease
MRVISAILAFAAAASAMTLNHERIFAEWKSQHGVEYKTAAEEAHRFQVFRSNAARIVSHNSKGLSWTMGLNQFADLTSDEFAAKYIGGYRPASTEKNYELSHLRAVDLPASVDWSEKGAVTPIKNQGQCGSCWAFSTTGSTEGITEISTGKLVSLSEQQLVDCSGSFGNQGCNGGLMDNAFRYIISNKGLCSEAAYPYEGADGTCKSSSCQSVATISGYKDVPQDSDQALMSAVAQQPVSVAVEADQSSFQFYSGGVLTSNDCGTNLDHGVLVVGYGSDQGSDYYKVKNSWGASWGSKGYILLGRGSSYNNGQGQCGVLMQPSYPTK